MEPENIGILDIIEDAKSHPEKFSTDIAKLALRIRRIEIFRRRKNGEPLNMGDVAILSGAKKSEDVLSGIRDIVELLIKNYAKPAEVLEPQSEGKLPTIQIDTAMKNTVAQACMQLLGNSLHKKHPELAHYIHNTPHIGAIIDQPERLSLLEHGIIPGNRIFTDIAASSTEQLWIGHDAKQKYAGEKIAHEPNIIGFLVKNGGTQNFGVEPIIQGDHIHVGKREILVSSGNTLNIHRLPARQRQTFTAQKIRDFTLDVDTLDAVESLSVERTGWTMYRLEGGKYENTGDGSSHKDKKREKFTLCVSATHPQLTFITKSKRYKMDKQYFTIDSEHKAIQLLSESGIETTPLAYEHTYGVHKYEGKEYLYFTTASGERKKGFFDESKQFIIQDISDTESRFFSN